MKTRIFKIRSLGVGLISLFLLLISVSGYSQACTGNSATVSIGNFAQTSTTIEFDVYVTNTCDNVIRFSSYGGNVIYNTNMLPSGATGTFTVVDQPNAAQFPGISASTLIGTHTASLRSLKWTFNPAITPAASAPIIAKNVVLKLARFRFTSTLPWTTNFPGSLAFNHVSTGGNALQVVNVYCNTNTTSTSLTILNTFLTTSTGSAQQTPFTFVLNPAAVCPTAAVASNLVGVSPCANSTPNGSATITLTGAPSATSAVTYRVDGVGSQQNATLAASAFTVSGLSSGSHFVEVTYPSCSAINTSSFTIGAGAPLTTNNSQSVSACGTSYTWPTSGLTYNASGVYPFVSGCNTATLTLTLTPNTTTGSESQSVCGTSYTWPTSGLTYNASGVYPFV